MTDYTELVKALRCETSNGGECWEKKCQYLVCGSYAYCNAKRIMADAAAAIEALIGTVGDLQAIRERLEEENDALRLEPKRGEIVRCRECRWGHLCVMGQHLGLDGFCSKGEREVQE